jgi:hypothetical protein
MGGCFLTELLALWVGVQVWSGQCMWGISWSVQGLVGGVRVWVKLGVSKCSLKEVSQKKTSSKQTLRG